MFLNGRKLFCNEIRTALSIRFQSRGKVGSIIGDSTIAKIDAKRKKLKTSDIMGRVILRPKFETNP